MVIVYFDTSLLEYESEPGIPPYFLRLVGPIQLYLHWSQKTLVHIADAYPCHINRFGRVKNLMKLPGVSPITAHHWYILVFQDTLSEVQPCNQQCGLWQFRTVDARKRYLLWHIAPRYGPPTILMMAKDNYRFRTIRVHKTKEWQWAYSTERNIPANGHRKQK